jgi:hypothetical protein
VTTVITSPFFSFTASCRAPHLSILAALSANVDRAAGGKIGCFVSGR